MSSTSTIPIVTEDLLAFHSHNFGRAFQSEDTRTAYEVVVDDGLGYYPDGVKRTLTDEQIMMFRHSEIHSLRLQLQRVQQVAEAERNAATAIARSEGEDELQTSKQNLAQDAMTGKAASVSSDDMEVADAEDEEAEYARFLEKERQEFAKAAEKQREENRRSQHARDRTVSTRRKVRELDAPAQEEVVLDY